MRVYTFCSRLLACTHTNCIPQTGDRTGGGFFKQPPTLDAPPRLTDEDPINRKTLKGTEIEGPGLCGHVVSHLMYFGSLSTDLDNGDCIRFTD